ncbi:MAG: DoxX family membrane protein [Verrucomicrobia bacterium]|nr:DoxX family membrane protein [Verrucomicrobiota bacterium]
MNAVSPRAVSGVVARWILGVLYVWMGMSKALDPVGFLKLVHAYDLAGAPGLLNLIAAALPWFEVFCGLLLLLGVAVRGTSLLSVVMLVSFTLLVLRRAMALHAGGSLPFCAIKFDCGCGTGEILICRKLAENFALTLGSLGLVFLPQHRLSLRPSLFRRATPSAEATNG